MTNEEVRELKSKAAQATKDFDEYNTVAKKITVSGLGDIAIFDEMISGHIKFNGSEIAKNFDDLKSQMDDSVIITIKEVK